MGNSSDVEFWRQNYSGSQYFVENTSIISKPVNKFGDFNGDGLVDILGMQSRTSILKEVLPNGQTTYVGYPYPVTENRFFVLIKELDGAFKAILELPVSGEFNSHITDINQDGLSDILVKNGGVINVYISNGVGFENPVQVASVAPTSEIELVDFNQDGYVDLVEYPELASSTSLGFAKVNVWDVNRFEFVSMSAGGMQYKGEHAKFFMDFNGDGSADYLRYKDGYIEVFEYVNQRETAESITLIDSGSGADTSIEYEKLNNTEHYSALDVGIVPGDVDEVCNRVLWQIVCSHVLADADDFYTALNQGIESSLSKLSATAPTLEMNGPIQVVTRVSSQAPSSNLSNDVNGSSGNTGVGDVNPDTRAAVEYYYGEARMQAGGRGFLGFHTLSSVDVQTGIKTSTIYRQDFPFIGSPLSTFVYSPYGQGLLSESHNVYDLQSFPGNAETIVANSGTAALGPIKSYLKESIQITYGTQSGVSTNGEIELLSGASVSTGTCADGSNCHPYLGETTDQVIIQRVSSANEVDDFGNSTKTEIIKTGVGLSETTLVENDYGAPSNTILLHGSFNLSYPQLGRLIHTTVTKSKNGVSENPRYTRFEYYPSASPYAGMLWKEYVSHEGDIGSIVLAEKSETEYEYNSLGLVERKSVTAWDGKNTVTRAASSYYDASGRFLDYSTDVFNRKNEEVVTRNEYGSPTKVSNANGGEATTSFDAWGRELSVSSNSGGTVSTQYVSCPYADLDCPSYATTAVIKRSSASSNNITGVVFHDALGREIRKGSLAFGGTLVYTDTEYDVNSRVVRRSLPYFENEVGGSLDWARNYYDKLGQVIKVVAPDGSILLNDYQAYSVSTTNALNQVKTETRNGLGELIRVEDEMGGKIEYTYTTEGHLRTTTAVTSGSSSYDYGQISGLCQQPTSNLQTVLCYDRLGRKEKMWDPDKGYWTYEYNAFGELIRQTNAKGETVETEYDLMGRNIKRWDKKANGSLEGYTTWHYDDEDDEGVYINNALHQLTAIAYSSGSEHAYGAPGNAADHATRYYFDPVGRPQTTETQIEGEIYRTEVAFDNEGRVEYERDVLNQLLFRSGTLINSGTQNHFDAYGFLERVTDLDTSNTVFEPTGFDAKGNLLTANAAHGKIAIENEYFDKTGNKKSITVSAGLVTQNFNYAWDSVGNLKSRINQNSAIGSNHLIEEFCYDDLNRIVKSYESINGTGTLSNGTCPTNTSAYDVNYDQLGNITNKVGVGSYQYGAVGSNQHRAGPHALTSLNNSSLIFNYDANGNLLSDGERSFVYSTFDKPIAITKGLHTTEFKYGPTRSRYYRKDSGTNGVEETWYLGNVEKIRLADGSLEWRRSLDGSALFTYKTNASTLAISDLKKRYIIKDHLGSSSLILEENGNDMVVAQNMSFDVWGQRRSAANMQALTSTQLTNFDHSITKRGYTGHEMVDEVGVIHMNGRIYDPRLGRFLQADPFVQAPTDLQSYNRYAYVRNNPLNATDPSGYFLEMAVYWAAVGFMSQQAGELLKMPELVVVATLITCSGSGGWACNAAFSFGSTFSATGNISKAAFSATISVFNTGLTGALSSAARALNINDLLAKMIIGGTMSKLSGGKFKNGAASSIFWWLVDYSNAKNPNIKKSDNDTCLRDCFNEPDDPHRISIVEKNSKYGLKVNADGVLVGEIDVGCKIYTKACDSVMAGLESINESEKIEIKINRVSIYKDSEKSKLDIEIKFIDRFSSDTNNGYFEKGTDSSFFGLDAGSPDEIGLQFYRAGTSTVLHEFGHALGHKHMFNDTLSIMSYDLERRENFVFSEVDAIVEAYR